ncbi:dihydrofolate reductase family protein [Bacillus paranthracis]|uniref:dihydrofolate reductase family protein n=1 Tax=Bacillus TaxID=1386 RepID=UPI0022E24A2D|nr:MULTISPECIES: dihydrofolate reductase family protein [Bacillus cereus group]MDA1743133.1 dihydrofolate reductase family protein [Bacillus cereus group sp. LD121LC]MDK7418110.1 dihydrofolate reductase family protein [Bacillus paranthracis]MDK7429651.1 dihydrofolate reductase family protein [Bacillus paranthracis]MDK7515662.1 dihydrofolate reductase family protein [Bacillus paranthracis]MDK7574562.1 dihydrofolate reductase family protein [Bacillus paranthracis]
MGKIIVSMYLSLDGVMEEPAWTAPYFNEEVAKFQSNLLFESEALLLGRVTYQGFAAAWPSMTDEEGFADKMNSIPKFVASTTLEKTEWNANLIKDNVIEEISKLKEQPGQNLLIYGSGDLTQTLMQHDLIDEYHFIVNPVIVGSGKRLFKDQSNTTALKLIETRTTSSGVVILSYQPEKKE